MGYSVFQKTVSDLLETLSNSSENRVYRPAGSISGKDIVEAFKNGVRSVNLVPYSYMGGVNPLTNGDILEPTGISEYFTREVVKYSASSKAIKYTCIKDIPKDTEILIFDSGNEYPSYSLKYPWLIILLFIGKSTLKDGSRPNVRLSVTDLTTNTEIKSIGFRPGADFRMLYDNYLREWFQSSEVKISAKSYISGNIVVGDVIEVAPPIVIGADPFNDFSRADEIAAISGNYDVVFSGTLEEYSSLVETKETPASKRNIKIGQEYEYDKPEDEKSSTTAYTKEESLQN